MESLLPALLACFIVERGDRAALLSRALSDRYGGSWQVALGMALAVVANAAIATVAATLLQPMMGSGARSLFLAFALFFAGVGMLFPVKAPDTLDGWRIGPLATAALGLFILGFGDAAQFLIVALGIWGGDTLFSAIGGGAGILAACVLGMIGLGATGPLPLRVIRHIGGGLFCLIGLLIALGPLGLV